MQAQSILQAEDISESVLTRFRQVHDSARSAAAYGRQATLLIIHFLTLLRNILTAQTKAEGKVQLMVTGKKYACLLTLASDLDDETGDRTKVTRWGWKLGHHCRSLVPALIQHSWGNSKVSNLTFSVKLIACFTTAKSDLYFDGNLYEIKSLNKAIHPLR